MKIKMQGSELRKVDIEFLSLVKRGANRAPFKVVKSEGGGITGAVRKYFQMGDANPSVVAVFVEQDALERTVPNLAKAGFDISKGELLEEGAMLFKQVGFEDCKAVVMVKSEKSVGFAVANVAKYADCFAGSLSFDENVAQSGFYPGLNTAIGALQSTICNILSDSDDGGEALSQVQGEIKAFADYVTQMLKALPEEVWKFETLQRGFGSGTVVPNAEVAAQVEAVLKAAGKGGKQGGVRDQAKVQTDSSSAAENANQQASTTSTTSSEMPGSQDDSPDDENARKERMSKAAAATTSTSTTEAKRQNEGIAKDANGQACSSTTTSSSEQPGTSSTTTSSSEMPPPKKKGVKKDDKGNVVKDTNGNVVFMDDKGDYIAALRKSDGKVVKYTPGAKIPEGHTTLTEEWEQDERNGEGNSQGQGKAKSSETADNELHHTGAGGLRKEDVAEMLKAAFAPVAQSFTDLSKTVTDMATVQKKQGERLDGIEKTAREAVTKAERTVVHVGANYDSARESLGGGQARRVSTDARTPEQIRKAEYPDSLWAGSLGAIERHRVGEGE